MDRNSRIIKCVAVGDGFVGKTCLLSRLANKPFQENYLATIFDNTSTQIMYEGQTYNVHLIDTAGQEEYGQIRSTSYADANLILVCFSVENAASFGNVTHKWLPEARKSNAGLILVGTKSDLRGDSETMDRMVISQDNYVNSSAASILAKRFNSRYIECSSKTDDNIERLKKAVVEVSLFRKTTPETTGVTYCLTSTWGMITRIICCRS